jgi:hypothetical protein
VVEVVDLFAGDFRLSPEDIDKLSEEVAPAVHL